MAKKRDIDFSGVDKEIKRGTSRVRVPEADYVFKIIDHTDVVNEDKEFKGFRWNCQVHKGKYKGKRIAGFTSISPQSLWNLRNLINAALGKNVAGKKVAKFDPTKLYGKIVGGEVVDNEFGEGKKKRVSSQINTFFPADEVGADEDDEEDEEEDEEEEDEEDEEEEDEDLEDVEVEEL